jgi:hypothetical protein
MADDNTRKPQSSAGEVVFRDVIDGVAMVEAFADPRPRGPQLEALPRPAPPQEEPRPWWRWRPWPPTSC